MHPAPSVIIFTSFSGLGFGLLFFLGFGMPVETGREAFWFFFFAYGFAVGGLLASTLHLGNPQRAMKAFSQWRTSWLSREGVSAVASLLVMAVYAIGLIFFDTRLALVGYLGGALSLLTVFTTSKIYNQLKTVPRWHIALTPVMFLTYAIVGGALLVGDIPGLPLMLLVLTGVQVAIWMAGDRAFREAGHTIETATGLGNLGKVRLLEGPHSSPNYLLKEMVHVVGRKHAVKLRWIAGILIGPIPALMVFLIPFNHNVANVAALVHLVGLFAARWLFFAEAEHVVGLYYDKR